MYHHLAILGILCSNSNHQHLIGILYIIFQQYFNLYTLVSLKLKLELKLTVQLTTCCKLTHLFIPTSNINNIHTISLDLDLDYTLGTTVYKYDIIIIIIIYFSCSH